MGLNVELLSESRRDIMYFLKLNGPAAVADLSSELRMTGEAVRQHLLQLLQEGLIKRQSERGALSGGGRPSLVYSLTAEGEQLFPKNYDDLTIELLDIVIEHLGPEALKQILSGMTEKRVRQWDYRLRGLKLNERVIALKDFYSEDDSFMEVDRADDGQIRLIERNCPFANVAMKRPALCSVTVNVLSRLLGFRVIREERFQNGDNRCVFRLLLEHPVESDSFSFEE